jgi:hypothetical protein
VEFGSSGKGGFIRSRMVWTRRLVLENADDSEERRVVDLSSHKMLR